MQKIKQSSATRHIMFLMVDSTDHVTGKTGLTPTVTISKNAAAFASPAGAVTEVSSGWYKLAANATDSNTLGLLALHATGTGADPVDFIAADVVAYDPDNAVRMGMTALPNAAAEAAGGLYTRGTGAGQINQPANGQIDANTAAMSAGVVTAAAVATGAIDADALAADAGTEIAAAILAAAADGSYTVVEILRVVMAVLGGQASGLTTTTALYKNAAGTKTRVTATVDADGNRSAITYTDLT